jgi:hypothetical protein
MLLSVNQYLILIRPPISWDTRETYHYWSANFFDKLSVLNTIDMCGE